MRDYVLSGRSLVALICLTSVASGQKLPVPSTAEEAQAMKLVKSIFQEDYENARTPEQKAALVKRLRNVAAKTKDDPAPKYALLKVARQVAIQAGNVELTESVVADMASQYRMDGLRLRQAAYKQLAASLKGHEPQSLLAQRLLALTRTFVAADQFEEASVTGEQARALGQRLRDATLLKSAKTLLATIEERKNAYQGVKQALNVLDKSPNAPTANLLVGRYRCFVKNEWAIGLQQLALGSDSALKAVAQLELSRGPAAAFELGESWWKIAASLDGQEAIVAKARAVMWYRKSLAGLDGLKRKLIEKRIETVSGSVIPGETVWTPLMPSKATAMHGTLLQINEDASILATGKRVESNTYTVFARCVLPKVTGFRVEVLPDKSLPKGGPGRADSGNFVLTEFRVFALQSSREPVALQNARASFEQLCTRKKPVYKKWYAVAALDNDAKGKGWGWAIHPRMGRRHEFTVELKEPVSLGVNGRAFVFVLEQNYKKRHTIGRFRISASASPPPLMFGD